MHVESLLIVLPNIMTPPTTSPIATPVTVTIKRRRSQRQQDGLAGTRRSARALKRRHAGNDARVYGDDYGILPSD